MTAGVNMKLCPSDETLAAYIDGRLSGADRQAIVDHLAGCAECRDVVLMAGEVQEAEDLVPGPVPVPVPAPLPGPWKRWAAPLAAAASVVVVLYFARDLITNQFNGGMTDVVNAYEKGELREVRTRTTGLPYRPAKRVNRGTGEDAPKLSGPYQLQEKYLELSEKTGERSWKEWRAFATAALLVGRHTEAVQAIENAARLAPNEPEVLNDLAAVYIIEAEYNPKVYAQRALDAADRAWKVARTPESAWNRAAALHYLENRKADAIQAWEEYLKLDSESGWAEEARENLEYLQQPL